LPKSKIYPCLLFVLNRVLVSIYNPLPNSKIALWNTLISGKKEQDLVVSFELMRGFEDSLIIDLAGYVVNCMVSSRSSSKFVSVFSERLLIAMIEINESLLKHEHECQTMLSRHNRPKIVSDIESIIGELKSFFLTFPLLRLLNPNYFSNLNHI
jgi:hypothetical protein